MIASLKAGFHMIANDRRRSQREMFPYNRRRSQTIAEPTVEGLPGVLGNKGTKGKYRREQGNMTPVLGNAGT